MREAYRRWVGAVDGWIFIKNGYSLWCHLVPAGVASLLLLLLSVPEDDLLPRLVDALARPGRVWLPAALLTLVSLTVYVATLRHQVRRAYAWPWADVRRTCCTALFYLAAVTALAALVLTPARAFTPAGAWACAMLAALSLAGVGWSGPDSWVERMGVPCPDYLRARRLADGIQAHLARLRTSERGTDADVAQLAEATAELRKELELNAGHEPPYARAQVEGAARALWTLHNAVEKLKGRSDDTANLANIVRLARRHAYPDLTRALGATAAWWPGWAPPGAVAAADPAPRSALQTRLP